MEPGVKGPQGSACCVNVGWWHGPACLCSTLATTWRGVKQSGRQASRQAHTQSDRGLQRKLLVTRETQRRPASSHYAMPGTGRQPGVPQWWTQDGGWYQSPCLAAWQPSACIRAPQAPPRPAHSTVPHLDGRDGRGRVDELHLLQGPYVVHPGGTGSIHGRCHRGNKKTMFSLEGNVITITAAAA